MLKPIFPLRCSHSIFLDEQLCVQIFPKKVWFDKIAFSPKLLTPNCRFAYKDISLTFCNSVRMDLPLNITHLQFLAFKDYLKEQVWGGQKQIKLEISPDIFYLLVALARNWMRLELVFYQIFSFGYSKIVWFKWDERIGFFIKYSQITLMVSFNVPWGLSGLIIQPNWTKSIQTKEISFSLRQIKKTWRVLTYNILEFHQNLDIFQPTHLVKIFHPTLLDYGTWPSSWT